jgi:hypothetical protein
VTVPDALASPAVPSIEQVLPHLRQLEHRVKSAVVDHGDPREIHRRVAYDLRFLEAARSQLPAIITLVTRLNDKLRDLEPDADHDAGATQGPAAYAERLSILWLGMYFWGVPFEPAWEQVRRIVEDVGGYPEGQCLNKALGDVFRRTRLIHSRGNLPDAETAHGLVVYTSRPMGMLPFDLMPAFRPDLAVAAKATTAGAASDRDDRGLIHLGRAYYWMQLRLCVLQGLPIHYIVVADALKDSFRDSALPPLDWVDKVTRWTLKTFGDPDTARVRSNVRLYLTEERPRGIPMCALGYKTGIYVLPPLEMAKDASRMLFPILGNRISRALLRSYREQLRVSICDPAISRVHRFDHDSDLETGFRDFILAQGTC